MTDDCESSVLWMNEGVGCDYGAINMLDITWTDPDWYVIEGIHGVYYRGEWGFTDDDEEWYFDYIRLATADEITSETLRDTSARRLPALVGLGA